jgi:virulence-associated protein VapD
MATEQTSQLTGYGERHSLAGALCRERDCGYRCGSQLSLEILMAHYAIAFDLDTAGMRGAGFLPAQITRVYQTEIPQALAACGFTAHPQGSLYHTELEQDPITALMTLQGTLRQQAPNFCRFVNRVHVFRMEEWSDVTRLVADRPAAPAPGPNEELEEQDAIAMATVAR